MVNSRLWVPMKRVFLDRAQGLYETKMYDERNCERCDFLPDRHSEMCDQCPSYLEHIKMWQVREDAKGKRWIGVPKGDRKRLSHFLADHDVEIVDKRTHNQMRQTIKFTGKLTEPQKKIVLTELGQPVGSNAKERKVLFHRALLTKKHSFDTIRSTINKVKGV